MLTPDEAKRLGQKYTERRGVITDAPGTSATSWI